MIQKILDIINSFPEFSREYINKMVSEFEKECVPKDIEGINCYMVSGNNRIYFVENTANAFRIAEIKSSKGKVVVNFGVRFRLFQDVEINFSKAIDEIEKMTLWENYFYFVFNKKVEKSKIFFAVPEEFVIHNKGIAFFVMKWTMKYLSKKSLVALDISKGLAELENYENSYFFLPCDLVYAWKEFFEYGTLRSMLAEKLGIKQEEVMAIGDGNNDVEMLEYANYGVAMGNARADVKDIADFITTDVDDDGITYALKHFGVLE